MFILVEWVGQIILEPVRVQTTLECSVFIRQTSRAGQYARISHFNADRFFLPLRPFFFANRA